MRSVNFPAVHSVPSHITFKACKYSERKHSSKHNFTVTKQNKKFRLNVKFNTHGWDVLNVSQYSHVGRRQWEVYSLRLRQEPNSGHSWLERGKWDLYIFVELQCVFIPVKYFKYRVLSSQILECITDLCVISEHYFLKLLEVCGIHCSYQGCTFLETEVTVENKFCTVMSNIWEFSVGKLPYFPSGA